MHLLDLILGALSSPIMAVVTIVGLVLSALYLWFLPDAPAAFSGVIFGVVFLVGLLVNAKKV